MTRLLLFTLLSSALACHRAETPTSTTPPGSLPAAPAAESQTAASPAGPLDGLDADIDAIMAAHDVPGLAIAIVHGDKVVLSKGYGVRERGKPDTINGDTVFAIASNTKAFVATAVGMLVAEGAVKWDDRVQTHLPELVLWDDYTTEHMRVRDLLCHRSGLSTWAGDLAWIGSKLDTATLMQRLRHVPPAHDFREAYGYTNLMFMVAGEVIASASGQTWDAFVQTRLLDPLGMKRTSTTVRGLAKQDNVATAHAAIPDGQAKVPYLDVDAVGAAAALNSSVNDMSQWVRMQLAQGTLDGTQVVPKDAIAESRVQHTPIRRRVPRHGPTTGYFAAYGLGWVLLDHFGRFVVTHSGGLPGMTSRVLLSPDDDLGVVVLTNSESGAASQIAQVVLARFVGEDASPLVAAAIAPRQAAASEDVGKDAKDAAGSLARPAKTYTGRFSNPLLGATIVTNLDGKLSLDLADHGGLMCELSPLRDDVFSCPWEDAVFGVSEVTFEAKRGRINSLRFKVRPSFVDPLEYRFSRSRR